MPPQACLPADGIPCPSTPSTPSNKSLEQHLDFDIKHDESKSDLMEVLQEPIKSAEKTANVSDNFQTTQKAENVDNLLTYENVENDDTWSQITSLLTDKVQHTSAASEGKEGKTKENSNEIEEEDIKGGGKSLKIQNNQTHLLDSSSPVATIPKNNGDSAALTESNSCSILIEEVKGWESTPQQICYNALLAKSPIGKSIESRSLEKDSLSAEIHSEIRYL